MEREQRRDDPHRLARGKRGRAAQHAQLALDVQRVAGLDLDGRDAAFHQGIETQRRRGEKLVVGRRLRRLHRRRDAAAGPRDLLIGRAGAAHRMFVRARAAEDQMGMTVDQARSDPRAAERDDFLRAEARQFGALADAHDAPVLDADGAMFDDAQRIARHRLHGRDTAVDEQAVPHAFALRRARLLGSKA